MSIKVNTAYIIPKTWPGEFSGKLVIVIPAPKKAVPEIYNGNEVWAKLPEWDDEQALWTFEKDIKDSWVEAGPAAKALYGKT